MLNRQWFRDRWTTIRDNAIYDLAKWGFLIVVGLIVYVAGKYLLPVYTILPPPEARMVAATLAVFVFAVAVILWNVASTRTAVLLAKAGRVASVAVAEQPAVVRPNIVFVTWRRADVALAVKDGTVLTRGDYPGTRWAGALVLVFQNAPRLNGQVVGTVKAMRADITFRNAGGVARVPSAQWLGFIDYCEFRVGATRELLLAIEGPKGAYWSHEFRRAGSDVRSPHQQELNASEEHNVRVRLFDGGGSSYAEDFNFTVTLQPELMIQMVPPAPIR
jgi:hypothetical protein